MRKRIFFFCFITLIFGCKNTHSDSSTVQKENVDKGELSINYAHLNHLYKELKLPNGKDGGIIHIYSNYPDYKYDIEPKEGFTCVDDVARAAILLSGEKGDTEQLIRLTEFLLFMQNENGWFNNFLRKDLSINKTYKTSVAQPDWWSWRALWALEKILPVLHDQHPQLEERVIVAIDNLVRNIKIHFSNLSQQEKYVRGIAIATNLPYESAADQASILLIGLCQTYERTNDSELENTMRQLANGILKMQINSGEMKGMFLSWENVWHAYGNTQSYALLLAGKILDETDYRDAALLEIDSFYSYLQKVIFPELISVESNLQEIKIINVNPFPQIAYGVRPVIYACTEAYLQTGKEEYKAQAYKWLSWFSGDNIASKVIYNSDNGRCYDGIQSAETINKNSGAESTIEALLSIQAYQTIK